MKRLAAICLLTACAAQHTQTTVAPSALTSVRSLGGDSIALAMVQRAFDADARIQTPDSLYNADAEVIANGLPRAEAPRFAGIAPDGAVQLASSRFSVTSNYVWGSIQYRWLPLRGNQRASEGWATFVMARLKDGEWRILQAHSSSVHADTI